MFSNYEFFESDFFFAIEKTKRKWSKVLKLLRVNISEFIFFSHKRKKLHNSASNYREEKIDFFSFSIHFKLINKRIYFLFTSM